MILVSLSISSLSLFSFFFFSVNSSVVNNKLLGSIQKLEIIFMRCKISLATNKISYIIIMSGNMIIVQLPQLLNPFS